MCFSSDARRRRCTPSIARSRLAEWQGVEHALSVLANVEPPRWLAISHLWDAVLADLHRRAGHLEAFHRHRDRALAAAPSDTIRATLQRRLS
jgi:predicted RNA polymerase sigma factor